MWPERRDLTLSKLLPLSLLLRCCWAESFLCWFYIFYVGSPALLVLEPLYYIDVYMCMCFWQTIEQYTPVNKISFANSTTLLHLKWYIFKLISWGQRSFVSIHLQLPSVDCTSSLHLLQGSSLFVRVVCGCAAPDCAVIHHWGNSRPSSSKSATSPSHWLLRTNPPCRAM